MLHQGVILTQRTVCICVEILCDTIQVQRLYVSDTQANLTITRNIFGL